MTAAITGSQWGWPFPLVLLSAGLAGAVAGVLAGLPSLRVRGLYFVLSTFAVHYIVVFLFLEYQVKFFDVVGVPYKAATLGAFELSTPTRWYFFLLPLVALIYLALRNTLRSPLASGLKKNVSCISRAGWPSGKFKAVKL